MGRGLWPQTVLPRALGDTKTTKTGTMMTIEAAHWPLMNLKAKGLEELSVMTFLVAKAVEKARPKGWSPPPLAQRAKSIP